MKRAKDIIKEAEFKTVKGIGRVPKDWKVNKLNDVADVKGGKRIPIGYNLEERENGHPYITVSDMGTRGIIKENLKYVPISLVEELKSYRIYSNELYISVAGTLGLIGEIPKELEGANLTENADKIINIKIDKKYLFYYMKSRYIQGIIDKEKTTNAQPKLALQRIRDFNILIPNNEEQQKIAHILSKVDCNIEKTEQIIEKYQKIKKGLMNDLLTGKVRIKDGKMYKESEFKEVEGAGKIPKDWESGVFVKLAYINPKKDTENLSKDDLVTFIAMEDTTEDASIVNGTDKRLSFVEKGYTYFKENDILFAKITPCLENGKGGLATNLTNGIGFGSTEFHVLRSKKDESIQFLYQHSKSDRMRKKAASLMIGSAGQQRIQKEFFEQYIIGIPSYHEQYMIGEILYKQDQLIEKEQQYLEKLKKLKAGLMEDLLTGKVRVM
jgi:type I restriction enzyme, S subunit